MSANTVKLAETDDKKWAECKRKQIPWDHLWFKGINSFRISGKLTNTDKKSTLHNPSWPKWKCQAPFNCERGFWVTCNEEPGSQGGSYVCTLLGTHG